MVVSLWKTTGADAGRAARKRVSVHSFSTRRASSSSQAATAGALVAVEAVVPGAPSSRESSIRLASLRAKGSMMQMAAEGARFCEC